MKTNGVELCVETFGDAGDPAILLIMGMGGSMLAWPEDLCRRLASGRRFVIRYDHRDTGRSVTYPPKAPGYTWRDLVGDPIGILDVLGIDSAHVAGVSMGGAIAQFLALEWPKRVASLTLLSTTLVSHPPGLPGMTPRLKAHFAASAEPDWTDRAAVIDYMVANQRAHAGSLPFDEEAVRDRAGRDFDRAVNIASARNHAVLPDDEDGAEPLGTLSCPTLVIHGTEDPLFPYPHGEALAGAIPGAELLPVERMGHEVPPREVWDVVIPAVLRHTSGGWEEQAGRLAGESVAAGDPTGWFERLYASAERGEVAMPWDRDAPNPLLPRDDLAGAGRALIVGGGLGADAEYIAGLGYDTTAFDISPSAVQLAKERHPGSPVRYVVADLLDPPSAWVRAFDLVVDVFTVQALPPGMRREATESVARLVAPGGRLIVITAIRDGDEPVDGPPWPLSRAEIEAFATDGLTAVRIEDTHYPDRPEARRWRATFRREP